MNNSDNKTKTLGEKVFDGLYVFSKFLMVIVIVVAICMSCGKASAEEMPSYASEPLDEWLFNHNFPSVFQTYLTSAKSECPYYVAYKVKESFYYLFLSPYENTFEPRTKTSGVWYPNGSSFNGNFDSTFGNQYLGSVVPTSNYSGNAYSFCWSLNGSAVNVFKFSIISKTGSANYCDRTVYSIYNSQTTLYSGSSYSTASNSTYSQLIVHGNMLVSCGGALTSVQTTIPTYSDDSRLQFATVPDTYGNKFLWINLSQFLDGTGSRISYDIPSLPTIILDINGSSQSFSLPDTYLINQTSNTSGSGNFVPVLRYQVPFSFFNFDDDDEVSVTNFTFSLTRTNFTDSETTDYRIACSYLMQTTATNAPSGEQIASDPDTITNKITNITYNEIVDKVNFADGYYSPEGGGGNPLVVPDGYTVKYVTITGTRTLASIIQTIYDDFDVTIDTARDVVQYITGISQTDAAERFIEDSVRDNHYTQSYDIVVYYWAPDASLGEVDVMYYYLTEAGRIRGISQIAADIYRDVNQTAYNTYALYDFLYQRLNDFEDKTLASLYEQLGVSKGIQSSVTLANSTLVDILNAINGLDIPAPSVDYTGLLQSILQALGNMSGGTADMTGVEERLDKLINHFLANNSDNESTNYLAYVDWLAVNDPDDEKRTPFEWAFDTFDLFSNIYDFFNTDEDPYDDSGAIDSYWFYGNRFVKWLINPDEIDLRDPNGDPDLSLTMKMKTYFGGIFGKGYGYSPHNVTGYSVGGVE